MFSSSLCLFFLIFVLNETIFAILHSKSVCWHSPTWPPGKIWIHNHGIFELYFAWYMNTFVYIFLYYSKPCFSFSFFCFRCLRWLWALVSEAFLPAGSTELMWLGGSLTRFPCSLEVACVCVCVWRCSTAHLFQHASKLFLRQQKRWIRTPCCVGRPKQAEKKRKKTLGTICCESRSPIPAWGCRWFPNRVESDGCVSYTTSCILHPPATSPIFRPSTQGQPDLHLTLESGDLQVPFSYDRSFHTWSRVDLSRVHGAGPAPLHSAGSGTGGRGRALGPGLASWTLKMTRFAGGHLRHVSPPLR